MQPDLKHLKAFDEIYKTRSISNAAENLGVSQPSISLALSRLRQHFRDPLFVRTSAGMQPTPRAEALLPPLRNALEALRVTLGQAPAFEPATSDHTFRICVTDIGQVVLLPSILNRLKILAPRVKVDLTNITSETPKELETGHIDLAVGFVRKINPTHFQQSLFKEHFACIVSTRHPRIASRLTLSQFLREGHVAVTSSGTGHWIVERTFERKAFVRNVALRVPNFLGLAQIIENTDLLSTVPARLGTVLAASANIRVVRLPVELPTYHVKQYWHQRHHHDPAHKWLRAIISDLFVE
jgi:DNA-binding transcriptional LysR family regulator